jgi:hypothetical protein
VVVGGLWIKNLSKVSIKKLDCDKSLSGKGASLQTEGSTQIGGIISTENDDHG